MSGSSRCCSTNSSKSRRARSSAVPVANGREPVARAASSRIVRAGGLDGAPELDRDRVVGRRALEPAVDRLDRGDDVARRQRPQVVRLAGLARQLLQRRSRPPRRACPPSTPRCGSRRGRSRAGSSAAAAWPGSARRGSGPGATRSPASRRRGTSSCRRSRARAGRRRPACPCAITSARSRPPAPEQNTLLPCSSSFSIRAGSPSSRRRIGAPDAEQVILGVDVLEREPLVRVQVALEDPPDAAVGLRHLSHPRPLVRALGRRRERARVLERGERGVGEGGVAVELGGVGRDLVQDVLCGEGGHAGCTTPGWNAGFPIGIGTGQSGVSGPGVRPCVSRRLDQQRHEPRGLCRRVAPRPDADPVVREHDPAARRASDRRASLGGVAAPVVRVRAPADDLQPPLVARPPAVKSARCPHGIRHLVAPPITSSARSMSASTSALRDVRMPQVRVPVHLDLVPGVLDPFEQVGMLPRPAPRARRTWRSRRRSSSASSTAGVPRGSGPSSKVNASTPPETTQITARLTVAWWA